MGTVTQKDYKTWHAQSKEITTKVRFNSALFCI